MKKEEAVLIRGSITDKNPYGSAATFMFVEMGVPEVRLPLYSATVGSYPESEPIFTKENKFMRFKRTAAKLHGAAAYLEEES
jgi:hypothetical protein